MFKWRFLVRRLNLGEIAILDAKPMRARFSEAVTTY